jgi:hypothetical protein
MLLILLGLPFVLFGALTNIYAIEGRGKCLYTDPVNWGPFCFAANSMVPEIVVYGAVALGLGLMILGNVLVRRRRFAARKQ